MPPMPAQSDNGPDLSVVVPVYGCVGCLEELVDRLRRTLHGHADSIEVILVDDASPDGAWSRIGELAHLYPEVKGIQLSRNFGQHYAIAAGLEASRGALVVVMDCDLQDVPEEIPKLLAAAEKGYEIVFARRIDRSDSAPKRFTSWLFSKVLTFLTDVHQDHATANFGAFDRRVIETLARMPERERCFPFMVRWTGFSSIAIPVQHAPRPSGKSSYNFRKRLRLSANIILSYSDKPLRLVVKTGFLVSVLSFLIAAFSIAQYFHGDVRVAGYTSIIASIWLIGGVTIFCVGVVGLYVGNLFGDIKRRPYYIVHRTLNLTESRDG